MIDNNDPDAPSPGPLKDPIHRKVLQDGTVRWWFVVNVGRDPVTGRKRQESHIFDSRADAEAERARIKDEVRRGVYLHRHRERGPAPGAAECRQAGLPTPPPTVYATTPMAPRGGATPQPRELFAAATVPPRPVVPASPALPPRPVVRKDAPRAPRLPIPKLTGEDARLAERHAAWERSVGHSATTVMDRGEVLCRLRARVGRPLMEVTSEDLAEWQIFISPLALQSIGTYVSHVAGFYAWARKYGHRADDPAVDGLQRPRIPRALPRPIPDAELRKALECAAPWLRAVLALMAFCGMRTAEVAGLERHHIIDTDDMPKIVIRGKGDKDRIVPAPAVVLEALAAHGMPPTGRVFRSPTTGVPYSPNRLSQVVNKHLHSLGISSSGHKLRHYFGTTAYRLSGGDLLLTAELMGHASTNTTQGYAKYSDGAGTKLAALMDTRGRDLLGQPPLPDPEPTEAPVADIEDGLRRRQPAQGQRGSLRLIQGGAA